MFAFIIQTLCVLRARVLVDEASSRAWTEIAHASRTSWHIFVNTPLAKDGSTFAELARLCPFESVEARSHSYIGAALEHLLVWADLAAPLRFHPEQVATFQQRPPYTLARAALEASAQAVWMLNASDPRECIRRHLCLVRWDLREHSRSLSDEADKAAVDARDRELLVRVGGVFDPNELAPPRGWGWVVRQACEAPDLDLEPDAVERLWRAASGSAHGMYWPREALQVLVPVADADGGGGLVRVADAQGITDVLQAALAVTQYAVLKYAHFAGADLSRLLEESFQWLAGQIPLRPDADAALLDSFVQPVHTSDPPLKP